MTARDKGAAAGSGDFVMQECLQSFGDAINLAGAAWLGGPQRWADLWFRLGAENLRFAGDRLAAQAQFLADLSGCRDAESLAAAEFRYIDDEAEAYSSEIDRLSEVTHEVADAAARRDAA